jgi:hypothetical protein
MTLRQPNEQAVAARMKGISRGGKALWRAAR